MSALSNDATSALLRACRLRLAPFAVDFLVEEVRSRSWASATFTGARHELAFSIEGEAAEAAAADFIRDLDSAEFKLRGHILADIALVSDERRPGAARIVLEALSVEDG